MMNTILAMHHVNFHLINLEYVKSDTINMHEIKLYEVKLYKVNKIISNIRMQDVILHINKNYKC